VHLLCEGVGIRAISRLTGLHQSTVLNVLESAGERCAQLLDEKVRELTCESVQGDEIWSYVFCKDANNHSKHPDFGDAYTFPGIDRTSKLIISHVIGKQNYDKLTPLPTICALESMARRS
jgi:hypothetical protein